MLCEERLSASGKLVSTENQPGKNPQNTREIPGDPFDETDDRHRPVPSLKSALMEPYHLRGDIVEKLAQANDENIL